MKILKVNEYIHDTARPDGMPGPAVDHIKTVLSSQVFQNSPDESMG